MFLLPIAIILLIGVHFYSLRIPHVNNQEGEEIDFETEEKKFIEGKKKNPKSFLFGRYSCLKIFLWFCAFMVFFFYLVCYHYDFAMDPINFERANSLKTPPHIYPEWYFLWSYEVLRGFSSALI